MIFSQRIPNEGIKFTYAFEGLRRTVVFEGLRRTAVFEGLRRTVVFEGLRRTAVFEGLRRTVVFEGLRRTAVFEGLRRTAVFEGLRRTAVFEGLRRTAVFEGLRRTAVFEGLRRTAVFSGIQVAAFVISLMVFVTTAYAVRISLPVHDIKGRLDPYSVSRNHDNEEHKSVLIWHDMEKAQKLASDRGQLMLIFIEAKWCGICRRMEREVFSDLMVQKKMANYYIPVMIDVDSRESVLVNGETLTERAFARSLSVSSTPTIFFLTSGGEVLAHHIGFIAAERMALLLDFILSDQFGFKSFEEYVSDHAAE